MSFLSRSTCGVNRGRTRHSTKTNWPIFFSVFKVLGDFLQSAIIQLHWKCATTFWTKSECVLGIEQIIRYQAWIPHLGPDWCTQLISRSEHQPEKVSRRPMITMEKKKNSPSNTSAHRLCKRGKGRPSTRAHAHILLPWRQGFLSFRDSILSIFHLFIRMENYFAWHLTCACGGLAWFFVVSSFCLMRLELQVTKFIWGVKAVILPFLFACLFVLSLLWLVSASLRYEGKPMAAVNSKHFTRSCWHFCVIVNNCSKESSSCRMSQPADVDRQIPPRKSTNLMPNGKQLWRAEG